jgi:prepilin-type N-terminal cleavage/methylation domain-containing protein
MRTIARQKGFSLLETMVVVAIISIVTAAAVLESQGSIANYHANAALDTVVGQLRVARQLAITQRRCVTVTFNTSDSTFNPALPSVAYQVDYAAVACPGLAAENSGVNGGLMTQPLLDRATYWNMGGIAVPDTPMAFGNCGGNYGVCINGVSNPTSTMMFNASGQFTDFTGVNPINGTVFIGIPASTISSDNVRAVTIMGATGRVRPYTYLGAASGWIE